MSWIVLAAGIVVIAGVIVARPTRNDTGWQTGHPYRKVAALLTPAERAFHAALTQVTGGAATVFAKVRVADVVVPNRGLTRSARDKATGAIPHGHFDFLLCHNQDLSVVCAIDIDPGTQRPETGRKRDVSLGEVCATAGIPLLRVAAKSRYGVDQVRRLVAPYLSVAASRQVNGPETPPRDASDDKLCPNCRSFMIVRIAVDGDRTGDEYWACNGYPKCGYVEAINA